MTVTDKYGFRVVREWMCSTGKPPFQFQEAAWQHMHYGESGLVVAPTGCGKTFSVFLGSIIQFINQHPDNYREKKDSGLLLLWISPLRALAKDLGRAMEEVIKELGLSWRVGIRNGDTSPAERQRQKSKMPEVLIITPESLHLLLTQKGYPKLFCSLQVIAVDEWHELLGSKRGVQTELAISRLAAIHAKNGLSVWGISATIGNLREAARVLLRPLSIPEMRIKVVQAHIPKKIKILPVYPDEIETYPWAGHLGLKLADKLIPIIRKSRTTLIFINTRGMSEIWYHRLLEICPELSGSLALHHGSIDREVRDWVEENLHSGNLKAVVCTASLDLGVDFRPVETVIQVGSPKGVARFLQRAGRSGHSPDAESVIHFLPTHSLELAELAALKEAATSRAIECKPPLLLCYDVLIQYLTTLAVSDGFLPDKIYDEVKDTFCFSEMKKSDWNQIIQFITKGGKALKEYDEFRKVQFMDGLCKITDTKISRRHRMHIGTIVSDPMMKVKFLGGGYVGMIEEYFIARLNPGDVFTLSGCTLEFIMVKDLTAIVRRSTAKKAIVPSWNGGRMPLSANLGKLLRQKIDEGYYAKIPDEELRALDPIFKLQAYLSHVPAGDELLMEQIETKDGFHLFVYPFEGRLVHEAMAAMLAYRIGRLLPISFSMAMNDYGFELLSDQPIPVDESNVHELFSSKNLIKDIQQSVNSVEMARRKFRDIASIGGLIFRGYPGEKKKARHLQSSAALLFNVFSEYDPENLLIHQAYHEVMEQQMEEQRLRNMLDRIAKSRIIITFPNGLTPFCFPIKVDSMREQLSSEKLEDRIRKMLRMLERQPQREL